MGEREDALTPPSSGWKPLVSDVDEFRHHLDDTDMTEEEKTAFLNALWLFMVDVMSTEFGTHPVQAARASRNGKADRADAGQAPKRRDGDTRVSDTTDETEAAADVAAEMPDADRLTVRLAEPAG